MSKSDTLLGLDVSSNQLNSLAGIGSLPNLRQLNASNNALSVSCPLTKVLRTSPSFSYETASISIMWQMQSSDQE